MLKIFYAIFCLLSLVNGAWMLSSPFSWYEYLPAAVPHTGPFNSHFVRDIGVAYSVAGLGFGWCALHLGRCRAGASGLNNLFRGARPDSSRRDSGGAFAGHPLADRRARSVRTGAHFDYPDIPLRPKAHGGSGMISVRAANLLEATVYLT
jgi:hypothetical protein